MKTFIPALALLAFTMSATAQAETTKCTAITTVPFRITTPGVYCLTSHLSTSFGGWYSDPAITINASDVVLDLNGYKLDGSVAGAESRQYGIVASSRYNITIRNGTVRGFWYGIFVDGNPLANYADSWGHVIEDIRAERNTEYGMAISGVGNVIRNNQVLATGIPTAPSATGIYIRGPGARVINNDVIGAVSRGPTFGIGVGTASNSDASDGVVAGNRISNIISVGGYAGYGIALARGSNHIVKDNTLSSMQYGINISDATTTGKYMSNVTQGVATPYTGGTAAGTTNY